MCGCEGEGVDGCVRGGCVGACVRGGCVGVDV